MSPMMRVWNSQIRSILVKWYSPWFIKVNGQKGYVIKGGGLGQMIRFDGLQDESIEAQVNSIVNKLIWLYSFGGFWGKDP